MNLFRLLAQKSGKALGQTVKKDIKQAEMPWAHADKIKELASDSGLSKSYINGLISKSTKVTQLQTIKSYLKSARADNLKTNDRYNLVTSIETKIKKMEDYATFKKNL